jgi:hypothetical protein
LSNAYIGYTEKNGNIKTVFVQYDGSLDLLGIELNEYFKDLSDVKELITTTISTIEDGEVNYVGDIDEMSDDDFECTVYQDKEEFVDDMDADTYYYLFENDQWYVQKPARNEFRELDIVLEEEY